MDTRIRLAAALIALMVFGCRAPLGSPASAASDGTGGSGAPNSSGATRVESIPDTTMNNITAFNVKIPASWKFQSVLLQGGLVTCESYAFISWRAKSNDDQSFMEQMPEMLWAYGNGPKPAKGCLPINGPMNSVDFLKHVAAMTNVEYINAVPLPDQNAKLQQQWQESDSKAAAFYNARNLPAPKNIVDISAAEVRFKSGSVAMKGRMTAQVRCSETSRPGMKSILVGMASTPATTTGKCTADVMYLTAPEAQYAALVREWETPGMGASQNQEWGNAWVKRYADQGNAMNATMIGNADKRFAEQRQEIAHTMAVQQQVHDDFLATMQRGTDISIARTYDSMNARSTAASDMVDYSLDRQTVMNTNTGQLYKITNQVTVGGDLQPVHGTGTPY